MKAHLKPGGQENNRIGVMAPSSFVERDDIFQVEDTPTITVKGESVSISWLSGLLKLPKSIILNEQNVLCNSQVWE